MQAIERNEEDGGPSERGGSGGETVPPSNLGGNAGDRGYAQIFGVWGKERPAELSNVCRQNYCWEDIMDVINADLRDNYASSLGSVVPQYTAGQQNSSFMYGGVQNGGGGSRLVGSRQPG